MRDVYLDCPEYVGDEDCDKCMIKGIIFSCVGCEHYEDDEDYLDKRFKELEAEEQRLWEEAQELKE